MKHGNFVYAFAAASLLTACPGTGPVYSVNVTTDSNDATPGDGICADAEGACSLRAAIEEANAGQGAEVRLVSGLTYRLTSSRGALKISKDIILTGAYAADGTTSVSNNATIQPGVGMRIIEVGTLGTAPEPAITAALTAKNLTLRGVRLASGVGGANSGGAVAIRRGSSFEGENVNVLDNEAERGAAFLNAGTLRLSGGNLSGNRCNQVQESRGGAIWSGGTLQLTNVSLTNNTCDSGAAIRADGGTVTITGATIANNRAYNNGSAITSISAQVTIRSSTIVQNSQEWESGRPRESTAGALNITVWDRSFYDASYAPNVERGQQVFGSCTGCHQRATDPASDVTFHNIDPFKYTRQALAAKIHSDMSMHFPPSCSSTTAKAQCSMDVAAYLAQNAVGPSTRVVYGDSPSTLVADSLIAQNFSMASRDRNCAIQGTRFDPASTGNLIEELQLSSCAASLPSDNSQVGDYPTDQWKLSYVDSGNGNVVAPTCNNQPLPPPGLFASYQPACWSSFTFSNAPVTARCTDEGGIECRDPRAWQ